MRHPHTKCYPDKLFAGVLIPGSPLAAEVEDDPRCMLDSFSTDFVDEYPDVHSAPAVLVLMTIATLTKVGIDLRFVSVAQHMLHLFSG